MNKQKPCTMECPTRVEFERERAQRSINYGTYVAETNARMERYVIRISRLNRGVLRAKRKIQMLKQKLEDLADLRAENERYREALALIAENDRDYETTLPAFRRAREALDLNEKNQLPK